MFIRYAISTLSAGIIVVLLILSMHALIKMADPRLEKATDFQLPDFVHIKPDEVLNTTVAKPKKPPKPQEQPDKPELEQVRDDLNLEKVDIGQIRPQVSINLKNGVGLSPGDGEYLPIVKVAPVYPRSAQRRCLEGHVLVEFTVTKNGSVRDPNVVSSTSKLFEGSAKKAALKFKYKPRVVDGKAVETPGVQNKIIYKMKNCK